MGQEILTHLLVEECGSRDFDSSDGKNVGQEILTYHLMGRMWVKRWLEERTGQGQMESWRKATI